MNDVVDSFMRDITSGQIASAYRGLIRYSTSAMPDSGEVISEATQRRRELRKTIGLSIGFDPVGVEYASERVARVTRLERFDEHGIEEISRPLWCRPVKKRLQMSGFGHQMEFGPDAVFGQ